MSRLFLTTALSALIVLPVGAQPSLRQGIRVRVFTRSDSVVQRGRVVSRGSIAGTVVSSTPDSMVLRSATLAEPVVLPTAEVLRVDVSRGRPNHKWRGATIGGLLSGAGFVGLACAFSDGSCRVGDDLGGFLEKSDPGHSAVNEKPVSIAVLDVSAAALVSDTT